jgi:hypothetical protein
MTVTTKRKTNRKRNNLPRLLLGYRLLPLLLPHLLPL